jgi:hypothetical protein
VGVFLVRDYEDKTLVSENALVEMLNEVIVTQIDGTQPLFLPETAKEMG